VLTVQVNVPKHREARGKRRDNRTDSEEYDGDFDFVGRGFLGVAQVEGEEDGVKEGLGSAVQVEFQESDLRIGKGCSNDGKQKRLVRVRVRRVTKGKGRVTHDNDDGIEGFVTSLD